MSASTPGSALPTAILIAILAALSACGGSDSSPSTPPVAVDPPTPTTPTAPTPPTTPAPPTTPTPPTPPTTPPGDPAPPPVGITLAPTTTSVDSADTLSTPYWPEWARTGTTVYDGVGCASTVNYHIHAMLSIYKDGVRLALPSNIGRNSSCDYGMHTHNATGVVHIETSVPTIYTLGQFFAEWGQPLSASAVAGLPGKPTYYIIENQKITPFTGDPTTITLNAHREILIATGKAPTQVPNFEWNSSGL
jgi:hypothetical protein